MLIELAKQGISAKSQQPIAVSYDDCVVGEFKADLLVAETVVVELKSIKLLSKIHEMQLVNYLAATGKDIGLLLNFGEERVDVRRKVRQLNKQGP